MSASSTIAGGSPVALCRLLREDVDLAEAVAPGRRADAVRECLAPVRLVSAGTWTGAVLPGIPNGIGVLVLHGLLVRRVGVDGRYGAELLGDGSLLRPWQDRGPSRSLPRTTRWRVLKATRVALLDARVARRLSQYPELTERLIERALQRVENLAVNMAIVHHARVDVRLHMLFWHLVERWGRVGPNGVVLPLQLTHASLADLVAARRPTVTSALAELARTGLVRAIADEGWLLRGEPPAEAADFISHRLAGRRWAIQPPAPAQSAAPDLWTPADDPPAAALGRSLA